MVTYAEDNPFPSVLFAEHVDPANPGTGTQRLFVDTDHILKLIDHAGTVTTFAGGFANPMTTSGDIIYGGASGVATRLAKSTDGKVLTLASGLPSWATPSASGAVATDAIWDAAGDLAVGTGADTAAKLAIGAANTVLKSNGTTASWALPTFRGCRVTNTAATSLSNNTPTAMPFASEDFDTDAFHDTSTNNSRITIPTGLGGKYLITGQYTLGAAITANSIYAIIRTNATNDTAFTRGGNNTSTSESINISSVLSLVATDYIELIVNQNKGSAQAIEATPGYNWLSAVFLGA